MTDRLWQAMASVEYLVTQAERLPEDEQDALAARIEALMNDIQWERLLDDPARAAQLDHLAEAALADFRAGKTRTLDDVLDDRPS